MMTPPSPVQNICIPWVNDVHDFPPPKMASLSLHDVTCIMSPASWDNLTFDQFLLEVMPVSGLKCLLIYFVVLWHKCFLKIDNGVFKVTFWYKHCNNNTNETSMSEKMEIIVSNWVNFEITHLYQSSILWVDIFVSVLGSQLTFNDIGKRRWHVQGY